MFEEIILIAAFALAGAISGAIILNRIFRIKTLLKKKERFTKAFITTKEELQSLQFEKSLISQSITRVYEASYDGKIDLIERDRLLLKYKQQLNSYDKKIADLQSLVDISELADMRNGLVSLIEGRITAIDHKLAEISNKYGISTSDIIIGSSPKSSNQQPIIDRAEEEEKEKKKKKDSKKEEENQEKFGNEGHQSQHLANEETMAIREQKDQKKKDSVREKIKTEEKTIDEIQKEIMQALGRLEQIDPDSGQRDHDPSVSNKRDALSSN